MQRLQRAWIYAAREMAVFGFRNPWLMRHVIQQTARSFLRLSVPDPQLRLDAIPMTPTVIAYLVSSVALSVIFAAALAYLAAVTIRGARAGERPESGWTLAAVGAGLIIAAYTTRSWLVNVTPTPESQSLFLNIGYVLTITTALGYMALLGGLLLGLPSLDEVDDEEGDEDAIDEDAIDEDDVSASEGVPLDASADPSGARIEPA